MLERRLGVGDEGLDLIAGLEYAGTARRVMLGFKDGDRPGLARAFAPALGAAVRQTAARLPASGSELVLCPVPASRAGRRRRGYAPVVLLLRAAGLTGRSLLVARGSGVQKGLSAADREANAAQRMRARRDLGGVEIVLVDDVVTTGATLRAARGELEAHGARVRAAVAVAATPLRRAAPW